MSTNPDFHDKGKGGYQINVYLVKDVRFVSQTKEDQIQYFHLFVPPEIYINIHITSTSDKNLTLLSTHDRGIYMCIYCIMKIWQSPD